MLTKLVTLSILITTLLPYTFTINCYSYRNEKTDLAATHSRFINCEREFGVPSRACLKAEFLVDGSKEFVMGYCGDVCPAIFQSHHCIYQEAGQNFALLRQMSGTSSALAVCCCEGDLCNGVTRSFSTKSHLLLLLIPASLMILKKFI
ncbi:hypothetical protein Tcan_11245 [Toxocara canis]|uniref:Uncharacterized protein n=1 Tax=Toxocara canis TaxID=6265 RepID=A0A0B2V788_TOXCA|nr:hypothetical protein Tcan_11245 [Toxocara canis]